MSVTINIPTAVRADLGTGETFDFTILNFNETISEWESAGVDLSFVDFDQIETRLNNEIYVPVPIFDPKTIVDSVPNITITESFTGVFLDAVSSVTLVGDTDSNGVSASITNIDYDDLSVELNLNNVAQGYTLTIINPNGTDVYTFNSADIRGTGSAGTTIAEFDAGSSGVWINEGSLPFTLRPPGGTPSSGTGVLAAPTSFAYVEASGTVPGNTSIFRTGDFAKATELSFNYHMFGATMGDLFVQYSSDGINWTTVFTLSGQQQPVQADPYLNAVINMSTYPALEIRLLYTNAQTFQSDLCLDSLTLTSI